MHRWFGRWLLDEAGHRFRVGPGTLRGHFTADPYGRRFATVEPVFGNLRHFYDHLRVKNGFFYSLNVELGGAPFLARPA